MNRGGPLDRLELPALAFADELEFNDDKRVRKVLSPDRELRVLALGGAGAMACPGPLEIMGDNRGGIVADAVLERGRAGTSLLTGEDENAVRFK